MEIKKIYFDMDGVLADFERGVRELCGMEALSQNGGSRAQSVDDLMWLKIKEVGHFYDKLEVMEGAREMFFTIWDKYGDRCEILTGIPRERRGIVTSGEDKTNWMRRLISEEVKLNIVYRAEKKDYCKGKEYVLIDDMVKTINEWNEYGGTGVLHVSPAKTLETLKEMGIL